MAEIRRPLASGVAIAVGTVFGLVALGNASVEVALAGAVSAFVVMFALKFYFG